MKKFLSGVSIVVLLAVAFGLSGCLESPLKEKSADNVQQKKTAQALKEADAQIGMPAIKNFQERKLAKMIFELRDQENLVTYAYIVNHMTGELVFIGKCIGFGLPYSVQYTNPMRIFDAEQEGGVIGKYEDNGEVQVLPQADPNGLFMPTTLSATWLLMIDPKTGDVKPVYFEPEVIVAPFPLHK